MDESPVYADIYAHAAALFENAAKQSNLHRFTITLRLTAADRSIEIDMTGEMVTAANG